MGHKRSSKKSLIVRNRKGRTHIDNCKAAQYGYYQPSGYFTQIHHIVCISSMSNATISELIVDKGQTEFVRECLKMTQWDINAAPNTVGLPLKRAFVHPGAPTAWDNWPCHQVEHPAYTDKVSVQLHDNVWIKVLKKRAKCKDCGTECNIKAASVQKQLEDESTHWLEFLYARGSGADSNQNGTAYCWKNRDSIVTWYVPFSMNPDGATFRRPPTDFKGKLSKLSEYCSEVMFSMT